MLFFVKQKNNPLQQDCGVHLSLHGASADALTSGALLGFSTHPRSILNHKKKRALKSTSNIDTIVQNAIKVTVAVPKLSSNKQHFL